MSESRLMHEFGHCQDAKVDIREVVDSAQILLCLLQPLTTSYKFLQQLIKWERPFACVTLLGILNIFGILLPRVYITLGIIGFIGVMALIGYHHRQYRLLVKFFPSMESIQNNLMMDQQLISHHERMQDFRLILVLLHIGLRKCSLLVDGFYSLLKWEDLHFTIKCYIGLCSGILLLCILPLRFSVLLLIDAILLCRPISRSATILKQRYFHWLPQEADEKPLDTKSESLVDDAISLSSDTQIDAGIGTESDISDIEQKLADDSSSCDEAEAVSSVTNQANVGEQRENKPISTTKSAGVVGRILELKKRPKVNEKCNGCHVIFTTILKRRHVCSHCGNHFCSRCVSFRVPRSTFGATAPAAQTETVPVCIQCYTILTMNKTKMS